MTVNELREALKDMPGDAETSILTTDRNMHKIVHVAKLSWTVRFNRGAILYVDDYGELKKEKNNGNEQAG